MSLVMTASEREAFFAGVHVGVLAVNHHGLGPLAVPVWYGYQPAGEVVVMTGRGSRKERLIRAEGRFSICAQDENPPYRYVTAEGPVVAIEESPTFEQELEIVRRYLPPEEAEDFVKGNSMDQVRIRMRPERWLSTDLGKVA